MLSSNLKDNLFGLKSQLENLEKVLGSTPDEIKKMSEEKKEGKKFTNTEVKLSELLQKDKIIKLNIGGKVFKTKESTLKAFPGSKLAKALEEKQFVNDNEIFFDRTFNNFDLILNYLREKKINMKKLNKFEKEDLIVEMDYYGLSEEVNINKKLEYDLEWDQGLSKAGACTVDPEDKKRLKVHSTTCYTHFVTNITWKDEIFVVEFDSNVQQTDNYLYFGIVNESYSLTGNCMCCSPGNSVYLQCDGNFKINSTYINNPAFAFYSQPTIIGMKVNLQEKNVYFYIPDRCEAGPFTLNGNTFRLVAGHCNTGNGSINILTCFEA